jgi:hypothetical protein
MKPNKAKIDKRVDRVHSTNPLTLDKFLSGCEVTEVLAEINDNRAEITDMIIAYKTNSGETHFLTTPIEIEMGVYLLEKAKKQLLEGEDEP